MCLRLLIENGANIDHVSFEEGSPIYLAVQAGSLECTKLLVDAGCQLNLRDNFDEETPLDIAMRGKQKFIIEFLKMRGA